MIVEARPSPNLYAGPISLADVIRPMSLNTANIEWFSIEIIPIYNVGYLGYLVYSKLDKCGTGLDRRNNGQPRPMQIRLN